jgi:hypothetical protein
MIDEDFQSDGELLAYRGAYQSDPSNHRESGRMPEGVRDLRSHE